jgi:tripartite-type tricarboxylate transporter receptor subunit TctC
MMCAGSAGGSSTQRYPLAPVRLIEPFGAGGGPELVGRALAQRLSDRWGHPVGVENHPGAGATAAPALVAKAPADGYTLLINTSAHAYSAAAASDLPYDPLRDFVAVAPLTSQGYVLVAGKPVAVRTLAELVAKQKASRDGVTFGSTGVGTGTHLGIEKLNQTARVRAVHVPPSPGDAIADVIAKVVRGEIDYALSPISAAAPYLPDGELVALGVSGARRSPLLPDVPTIAEAGIAGYEFPIWYGIWAPAATPRGIVDKLAKEITAAIAAPELHHWLAEHGAEPMSMTPQDFASFVLHESQRATRILDDAGIEQT